MNNQDDQVQHQIIIDEIGEVGKAENQMDTTEDHPMPPATKRRKLPNKEVEDFIMGNELSDIHVNLAQNLLKAQFPQF